MALRGRADAIEPLEGFPRARIVFQPIIDLDAWSVSGFEALARFDDGTGAPTHLERAQGLGVREELELHLIALAVEATKELPGSTSVTFNASGVTILRPEIAEIFADLDRPWGLEIYEGATAADLATVRSTVTELGGGLLVDDAGAVCADATRITTLRPDVVKIDRALFWQIADAPAARVRLEGLLEAAREAGAHVLVEGISDAEQVERARRIGSNYGQGFHLGMPTPAAQIGALLADLRRDIGVDAAGL